jgi:glutathione peroxidase-family protein
MTASSFHELSANTIDLAPQQLSAYEGRVLLVVNVASECGNTPQALVLQQTSVHHPSNSLCIAIKCFLERCFEFGKETPARHSVCRQTLQAREPSLGPFDIAPLRM